MIRKVSYARLHQVIYAPASGDLGLQFPPHSKTLDNLVMTVTEHGLVLDFMYKGIKNEILIPLANVAVMALAPEDKPVKAVKVA